MRAVLHRLLGNYRAKHSVARRPEATAIVRQSGHWSVVLGIDRWVRHFVLDPDRRVDRDEDQLALLALCLGRELMRRLLDTDKIAHSVRVRLFATRLSAVDASRGAVLYIRGVITARTEASTEEVERWIPELSKSSSALNQTAGQMRVDRLQVQVYPATRTTLF